MTDYEQRQAAELAEARAQEKIVLRIGAQLGAKEEKDDCGGYTPRMVRFRFEGKPYRLSIHFANGYARKDQYHVSAYFDRIDDAQNRSVSLSWTFKQKELVESESANISRSKSVEQIAKEIKTRVLDKLDRGVATWAQIKFDTETVDAQFAKNLTLMSRVLDGRAPSKYAFESGDVGDSKMRAHVGKYSACPIKLTIDDLTFDQANSLVKLAQGFKKKG